MTALPDKFKCTITNWEYIYGLCRTVADEVRTSAFQPDIVVALARGGWFAGRCLCDFIGLDDLTSLKVEHYVGTAEKSGEPTVRYPLPEGTVGGKRALIVDDIADTGGSIRRAHEYVMNRDPATTRTATLQLLESSAFTPDYVGEHLTEWAWIVYPWNFIEDMIDLLRGVMEKEAAGPYTEADLRQLLAAYHDIERTQLEIAQPGRLPEVLDEMTRRGITTRQNDAWEFID